MRIALISYNAGVLMARQLLLERAGHQVMSAMSFPAAVVCCRNARFDLLILGNSIPGFDRQELIRISRCKSPAPILSLKRDGEDPVLSDYQAERDRPHEFLQAVAKILAPHQ